MQTIKTRSRTEKMLPLLLVPAVVLITASAAHAGTNTGGGLPWEGPLTQIQASLSGPVAKAISVIAVVVAGAALVFGEDLGQFARRLILVVLAVALIVLAGSFLGSLSMGALI